MAFLKLVLSGIVQLPVRLVFSGEIEQQIKKRNIKSLV